MSFATSDSWEKSHYLSLTLWDIDREFQKSYEAYEQWLGKNTRKRTAWECFRGTKPNDGLGKVLSLGRQVRKRLENGVETFGQRFEQGDSICHATLAAQLLRVQYEIRIPLEDCALFPTPIPIPLDSLLRAAKAVRRSCHHALREQYSRLQLKETAPYLPPPRLSVKFCAFALQLQKEGKNGGFQTAKVKPQDRHDEREICPYCSAHISVSVHSGLPDYRRLLFQAHIYPSSSTTTSGRTATFACTSCYKTFNDSYDFLNHMFQKEVGSERSCQKRWSKQRHRSQVDVESNPTLVETCLRNCLRREMTRAQAIIKKTKEQGSIRSKSPVMKDSAFASRSDGFS